MNLTAYSDSESDSEAPPPVPKAAVKPAPKPTFQKVIDRANPGKIKLNLPSARQQPKNEGDGSGEPLAKKARTKGGAFGIGGFLPAPKKPDVKLGRDGGASNAQSNIGVKTSAEPSFLTDSNEVEDYDEEGNPIKRSQGASVTLNLKYSEETEKTEGTRTSSKPKVEIPTGPVPAYMAAQMGRRRKRPAPRPAVTAADTKATPEPLMTVSETKPPAKPKVSLFSVTQEEESVSGPIIREQYEPLIYIRPEDEEKELPDEVLQQLESYQESDSFAQTESHGLSDGPSNTLTNIASELNLSAADKRRLFGRKGQGPDFAAANIVNFNTDAEYAHNEMVRQQGDTAQHNALKSISGTGKNSLQSLIRNASAQKEALEDHFAQGKANKKAAGNRYGW